MLYIALAACFSVPAEEPLVERPSAPVLSSTFSGVRMVLDTGDMERVMKASYDRPFLGSIVWEAHSDASVFTMQYELQVLDKGYKFLFRRVDGERTEEVGLVYTDLDLQPELYYNLYSSNGCKDSSTELSDICTREAKGVIEFSFIAFGVKWHPPAAP